MAFLDNSGDIVLDAVLTDLGRRRMAEGSFTITKFALGDEEINYRLFNPSDVRGSSHYDLEILQTPILEAFTSDQSIMKSRIVTFDTTRILYMPILKLNTKHNFSVGHTDFSKHGFYLLADDATYAAATNNRQVALSPGVIPGQLRLENQERTATTYIAIDQGIDSTEGGRTVFSSMDEEFVEDSFLIKVDNRFLKLDYPADRDGTEIASVGDPQFLDDDDIATYNIKQNTLPSAVVYDQVGDQNFRARHHLDAAAGERAAQLDNIHAQEMFQGPLANVLRLTPAVSEGVQFSADLFNTLGTAGAALSIPTDIGAHKFIDTTISVQGMLTGYSIDIPVRIVRKD
tara:strand:- start:3353 stop:4384 length:1032 start_codon:yes stop_codon:yes gene_type:complete